MKDKASILSLLQSLILISVVMHRLTKILHHYLPKEDGHDISTTEIYYR